MLVWLQAELAVIFMLLALTFICERSKRSASGLVSTPAIEVYLARLRRAHLLLLSPPSHPVIIFFDCYLVDCARRSQTAGGLVLVPAIRAHLDGPRRFHQLLVI